MTPHDPARVRLEAERRHMSESAATYLRAYAARLEELQTEGHMQALQAGALWRDEIERIVAERMADALPKLERLARWERRAEELRDEAYRRQFFSKTKPDPESDCILWTGSGNRRGYGQFWVGRKLSLAHRVAWEMENGPIPDGMCVCHTCDVRACVNHAHLWLGTVGDNTRDAADKNRLHKPKGELHPQAKLTEADVQEIRALAASGLTYKAIAPMFGIHHSTVSDIMRGKRWGHLDLVADALAAQGRGDV